VEELGAEFVGPTQDRVLALMEELNVTSYQVYTEGNSTLYRNGTATPFMSNDTTSGLPPLDPEALVELQMVIQEIDIMASGIDVLAPWNHTNATEWDSMTFQSFLSERLSYSDSLAAFQIAVPAIFSTELNEPSLLYVLSYIAAAGNETTPGALERLIGVTGAAQDSRINGGTQLIALRLAEKLGMDNIRLQTPVRKISYNETGCLIEADGFALYATRVVVAMSPPLAGRIIYDPPLPAGRDQLTQRMPMGAIGKAIAIYPSPWWRDHGLNAQATSDSGLVRATFDNSPANGSFGAIMGFIEADEMRKADQLDEEEIKALLTADLVKYFGPSAANMTTMLLQRWDLEEFSRGGPVAYGPPGVLTQYGSFLRTAYSSIHFAGTETSTYWVGYMDGAVRSGERAAAGVLALL
jgi:monoamine oxidase